MTRENSVFRVQQRVLHIGNDSKQTICHIKGEDVRDSYPYLIIPERGRVKIFQECGPRINRGKRKHMKLRGTSGSGNRKGIEEEGEEWMIKMHYTYV